MNLLDRAIKLAAEQDEPLEMNFVRKHALQQAEDLGVSVRDAATRVFSNASGERPVLQQPRLAQLRADAAPWLGQLACAAHAVLAPCVLRHKPRLRCS